VEHIVYSGSNILAGGSNLIKRGHIIQAGMVESSQDFPQVLLQLGEIVSQASLIEPGRFKTGYCLEAVAM
jgi:hypothetical protein